MNTLFVSEEYDKLTKGLFRVWSQVCARAPAEHTIEVLLNREHWLISATDEDLTGVARTHVFPVSMPHTVATRISRTIDHHIIRGACRFALRNALSLLVAPLLFIWLIRLIRQQRIAAVVSHHGGWPAGAFARWTVIAARLAGVRRNILVIHSFPSPYSRILRPLQRLEERLIGLCADEIVSVSHAAATALAARNFERPIRVIHNGIDVPHAQPCLDDARTDAQPIIGYLGALVPNKGPHILLDAALLLDPACRVELAGPGEASYIGRLKTHAANASREIVFLGALQDVHAFLRRIDILIVPSIDYEAFGMVILEAMLHCKPVICSDFGGMKEIVVNGETGLVVPAGNPAALASAITTLLADAPLRAKMGAAGYERLQNHFTVERMAAEHFSMLS